MKPTSPSALAAAGATAAALALALTPAGAVAARGASVTASPNPVRASAVVTIRGSGWPVIEFCERRVRLTLESAQNAVTIGTVAVGDRGGFRRRWRPSRSNAGPGRWRVVARMRCESGDDGSPVPVVRRVALRIVS